MIFVFERVELNCLGAKVYCCMVEGIGCNHSLAWKIDQIDFLKQFFIMLSSNEEVLMEQAVLAFGNLTIFLKHLVSHINYLSKLFNF